MGEKRYTNLAERAGQGIEKLLGELELAVMEVLWVQQSATVRTVLETLVKQRPLAYTTVMTILGRLVEKGLLAVKKEGKTYLYRPLYTRTEFEAQAVGRVVQSLLTDFGGEVAVAQFVERLSALDPDQLARLAELTRQAQGEAHET